AGTGAVLPRLPSTIEALEEVRKIILANADALVFDSHQQSFLVKPMSDDDAGTRRRILRGIFKQVRQRSGREARINIHNRVGAFMQLQVMIAQRVFKATLRGFAS